MLDLRLLGISARIPVSDLARHLLPWSRVGLLAVAVSGNLHVLGPRDRNGSPTRAFWVKLSTHRPRRAQCLDLPPLQFPSVAAWDRQRRHCGRRARSRRSPSLALWAGVVTCGRLLALSLTSSMIASCPPLRWCSSPRECAVRHRVRHLMRRPPSTPPDRSPSPSSGWPSGSRWWRRSAHLGARAAGDGAPVPCRSPHALLDGLRRLHAGHGSRTLGTAWSTATNAALLVATEPVALVAARRRSCWATAHPRGKAGAVTWLVGATVIVVNGVPGLTVSIAPHWRGTSCTPALASCAAYSLLGRPVLARYPSIRSPRGRFSGACHDGAAGAIEWRVGRAISWTVASVAAVLYLGVVITGAQVISSGTGRSSACRQRGQRSI